MRRQSRVGCGRSSTEYTASAGAGGDRRRRSAIVSVVWALAVVTALTPVGAQPREAGYVIELSGYSDHYNIERGGQLLKLHLLATVHDGDRVLIRNKDGRVGLKLGAREPTVFVTKADAPYTVRVGASPPSPLTNAVRLVLGPWLTNSSDRREAQTGSLGSKGRLQFSALGFNVPNAPPRLLAGPRDLSISWNGGSPPFAVRASRLGDNATIAAATAQQGRAFTAPQIDLKPGDYAIEVVDADLSRIVGTFTAIESNALAGSIEHLSAGALSDPMGSTIYAAWLARQGNGVYTFEAFQVCWRHASAYQPARVLCEALAGGQQPPPTPQDELSR